MHRLWNLRRNLSLSGLPVRQEKGNIPEIKFKRECWHCNTCVLDCPSKAIQLHVPLPYMLVHVNSADLKPRG